MKGYRLQVQLASTRALFAGSRRSEQAWKQAWENAGRVAAREWLDEYLPLHFEAGSSQRYRYAPRNPRWNRAKARGKAWVARGVFIRIPTPPTALVWKGQLQQSALANRRLHRIESVARMWQGRPMFRVRVRIPLPHPLNPKNRGELTRMTPTEARTLARLVFKHFKANAKRVRQRIVQTVSS
jgi:hypothetical protein